MAIKDMDLAQINNRLDEIAEEREELEAIDFDKALRKAVTEGGDGNAIEEQEAKTQRRLKHLRIEADALSEYIPSARQKAAQPELDAIAKVEQKAKKDGHKAAQRVMAAIDELNAGMADYEAADGVITGHVWHGLADVYRRHQLAGDPPISYGIHHNELHAKLNAMRQKSHEWVGKTMKRNSDMAGRGVSSIGVEKV